jgi:four helix bundle protein
MLSKFRTYQAAVAFHHGAQVLKLPRYLRDQMDRASSSVCLNLAEGAGKTSFGDRRKFYGNALASLRECQAVLDVARVRDQGLRDRADQLGGMLYRLCSWRP